MAQQHRELREQARGRGSFRHHPRPLHNPALTFVEQVARRGSISRSSRCSTALGQSTESRASMMNVSIWAGGEVNRCWFSVAPRLRAGPTADRPSCTRTMGSSSALVQGALVRALVVLETHPWQPVGWSCSWPRCAPCCRCLQRAGSPGDTALPGLGLWGYTACLQPRENDIS